MYVFVFQVCRYLFIPEHDFAVLMHVFPWHKTEQHKFQEAGFSSSIFQTLVNYWLLSLGIYIPELHWSCDCPAVPISKALFLRTITWAHWMASIDKPFVLKSINIDLCLLCRFFVMSKSISFDIGLKNKLFDLIKT